MVDWITIGLSILAAIIGASIGPYVTHKFSIKYLKKKHFFQEKIFLFEKLGGLSWKNHLALTIIENINKSKKEGTELEIIKQKLKMNLVEVEILLDKLIYFSNDLRKNLGKYITEFENYVNDKDFGKEERTKKLRENCKPFIIEINKIIEKELREIK